MDPSTNFLLIQSIIVWTLLGFLLTWMVVFAVLALRSHSHERVAEEDVPAASHSLPAISSLFPQLHRATSSTPQALEAMNTESTISNKVVARS